MLELKPCPFCGNTDLLMGAYSIADECYISCACGITLTLSVPWNNMTEEEHDKCCVERLTENWNRRVDNV